ncbi:DUF6461 domain-containing protein [Streptomyces antimycoticus]|uniref:DUF6461 domain-containing protein n=1 Tax=Streptomyces antimycoticus TaxID=68175 RepID=UPI00368B087A
MDGIRWVSADQPWFELGYWVFFIRDAGATEVAAHLRSERTFEPGLTRYDANDVADDTGQVVVRIGESGGWAYGVVEGGPIGAAREILSSLSVGTSAVQLWRTVNWDLCMEVARNGSSICRFGPDSALWLANGDVHGFDAALRGAGWTEGADALATERALLVAAELTFALDLPRQDVLEGILQAALLDG